MSASVCFPERDGALAAAGEPQPPTGWTLHEDVNELSSRCCGFAVASRIGDDPTTWAYRFVGDIEHSEGDPTASAADRISR